MSLKHESFLVGLIGDGINASLTPPMHEAEADAHGVRYLYRPIDLQAHGRAAESLPALLDSAELLGFNAFNVTHPCKQSVLKHVDEVSEGAAALGAVNCVVLREDGTRYGDNTDYSGFMAAVRRGLPEVAGSPHQLDAVVQLGAGGAGSATAYALLRLGVRQLSIFDVDAPKVTEKAADLRALFPQAEVRALTHQSELKDALSQAQGLVNATPIGMHVHPGIPLDAGLLHAGLWVSDVIYLPQETELIRAARALGCSVLPGGFMAVGQAVDAFRLFTGIEPDAARMLAHFERLIADQQGVRMS